MRKLIATVCIYLWIMCRCSELCIEHLYGACRMLHFKFRDL